MKYVAPLVLLLLMSTITMAEPVLHTVQWEKGVNKKVVKEWSLSINKVGKVNSTTYIRKKYGGQDKLHKVGHRDFIVWIPETTDLTKDFILVFWFHGHWGYVPERTFEDRTLKQFVPYASSKNFALVIPEMPWSVHTKTPTKRNSRLWKKPGDFLKFVEQTKGVLLNHARSDSRNAAKTKAELGKIDYRIVGHSAGGSTIMRIGITGDICKLGPSLIIWSDSSYQFWLKKSWDGCIKNYPEIRTKVFVVKGDWPWRRATQFLGEFQGTVKNLELHVMKRPKWSHKLIGDNVVQLSGILEDQ